jgi:hypothetical protein
MFGNIKPALDLLKRLGPTDFSAGAPEYVVKPGATIKIPVSSIAAASAFNASTNNYLTGGTTDWASLTSAHYLQGFDITGVNVDQGVDKARMEQLFTRRAGTGIAYAVQGALKTALDGATASTGVTIPAVGTATIDSYMGLNGVKDWFTGSLSALAVNGTEYANIKQLMHAAHLSASPESIAAELGFKKVIVLAGLTRRACIVPYSSIGFIARVPELVADFQESGIETDPDSGLSIGIVVAEEQKLNRRVVNGDLWFGCAAISASANATTTKGIIKVGTSA